MDCVHVHINVREFAKIRGITHTINSQQQCKCAELFKRLESEAGTRKDNRAPVMIDGFYQLLVIAEQSYKQHIKLEHMRYKTRKLSLVSIKEFKEQ